MTDRQPRQCYRTRMRQLNHAHTHDVYGCLLPVLRVFRVKKLLLRYQETLRPVINAMRVSLQLVTIFLISHLMACLWYMAGTSIYSVQYQ
jgi:hypothetical protein